VKSPSPPPDYNADWESDNSTNAGDAVGNGDGDGDAQSDAEMGKVELPILYLHRYYQSSLDYFLILNGGENPQRLHAHPRLTRRMQG